KAQGREYIKEAEVAPHQEPGYKHAITPIMLKMACTIGGVHIRRFTRREVKPIVALAASAYSLPQVTVD
ncbi:hypothetical protein, partial [Pseudoalteromonas sp. OF7H-1]|uniref:hypothetical protein n=1 Tax=Pseudoalteromonas sp. OF7H-1 TaxID=2917755 RepID=UPI001EF57998